MTDFHPQRSVMASELGLGNILIIISISQYETRYRNIQYSNNIAYMVIWHKCLFSWFLRYLKVFLVNNIYICFYPSITLTAALVLYCYTTHDILLFHIVGCSFST